MGEAEGGREKAGDGYTLYRIESGRRTRVIRQFLRFGWVGVAGFLVDWSVVSAVLALGVPFYLARALSYVCAASATWFLNRSWTFARTDQPAFFQWLAFLAANAFGGAINYGVSVLLVTFGGPVMRHYPVMPVAVGSLAGMFINFALSSRLVFRDHRQEK